MKTATLHTGHVADVRGGFAGSDIVRKAVQAVSTWHKRRVAIRELSALSDRQLADIGLMRAEIPSVVEKLTK